MGFFGVVKELALATQAIRATGPIWSLDPIDPRKGMVRVEIVASTPHKGDGGSEDKAFFEEEA